MHYSVSKTNFGDKPSFDYPKPILEEMGEEKLKNYLVIFMI